MYDLIINYGPYAATLILGGISWLLSHFILVLIHSTKLRSLAGRAWDEIQAAVLEVEQTYIAALKEGREDDGKLSAAEKAEAKSRALSIAKENIGAKGLHRLARILGVEDLDKWIGGKIEAVVHETKAPKLITGVPGVPTDPTAA